VGLIPKFLCISLGVNNTTGTSEKIHIRQY
jgi:hypothetical protein